MQGVAISTSYWYVVTSDKIICVFAKVSKLCVLIIRQAKYINKLRKPVVIKHSTKSSYDTRRKQTELKIVFIGDFFLASNVFFYFIVARYISINSHFHHFVPFFT
jgi:hypothetical protein